MSNLIGRTILATLKGSAYLLGGFLFGLLPLLIVLLWKILKGTTIVGWKVTCWTIGAVIAGAIMIARNV